MADLSRIAECAAYIRDWRAHSSPDSFRRRMAATAQEQAGVMIRAEQLGHDTSERARCVEMLRAAGAQP